jgi:uncharacterized protein YukE
MAATKCSYIDTYERMDKLNNMANNMSYPTGDMSSTSRSLTSFLDEQWNQHTALFMNNHDSYIALLQAVARIIPQAGGRDQELANSLHNYHLQYQNCYQALHQLAQMIDGAAQSMSSTDQTVASGFGRGINQNAASGSGTGQTSNNTNQTSPRGFGRG